MAELDSKPTANEPAHRPGAASPKRTSWGWRLLPLGVGIIALLAGCGGGSPTDEPTQAVAASTPTALIQNVEPTRPPQSGAALTRVAESLAPVNLPTTTPTPAGADSALIPLPTVTPTLVPSPVATRTVELRGDATLRLQLNNQTFESSGQPVTIALDPRSYVLGGETMSQQDKWCQQIGPTGLVFALTYNLHPTTETLYVNGSLELYDGFCGEWGSLGNVLASVPMNVNVPMGTSVIVAPSLQFQGSLLGVPNVLDVSTGVFLELSIRNPSPR